MSIEKLHKKQNVLIEYFDNIEQRVFKKSDVLNILSENRDKWQLPRTISSNKLIDFFIEIRKFKLYQLEFPNRKEVRYGWDNISDYEIFNSLRPKNYFTHSTALFLHKLISKRPKVIYVNYEQPQKRNQDSQLIQERIDFAFQNTCRVSRMIAEHNKKKICVLNGKFTNQNGVEDFEINNKRTIRVTNIERTLIDSVVRPVYSGGVEIVLSAYKKAVNRVKIKKLVEIYSQIGYIYPYHQCIGFYLERSGAYSKDELRMLEQFEIKYDFYLCHKIKNSNYSKRWKLFYPSSID